MNIRSVFYTFSLVLLAAQVVQAQHQTEYTLSFPNAVHHEAEVEVWFNDVRQDTLKVMMPRTSPGRYALHEFAKNVYNVRAENEKGETLQIQRPSLHQWNIYGPKQRVKVTYTLFGDRADGTYNGINEEHAHLNMPATLMYAKGFETQPSLVQFRLPQNTNWKPATQLMPVRTTLLPEDNPHAGPQKVYMFESPDLQYLMDSPIELADFMEYEWLTDLYAEPDTVLKLNDIVAQDWSLDQKKIKMAIHHPGTAAEAEAYAEATKKLVEEAKAIFGELPDFDYNEYTFIACYMPYADGDGMEHRNSTILTSPRALDKHAQRNLGTVSHEFFHAWNVERIRPESLEPFNFQDANQSAELWFAEGFTSYYGDLIMRRSGALTDQEYAKSITGDLNYVLLSPGSQYYSAAEMSLQAPFVDAARTVDPVNRINTFISYYPFGSVIGLALDLSLRQKGLELDGYMQQIWQKYGKPEKPYTNSDLEKELALYSNNEQFAADFFSKYIYGHEFAPYADLLMQAGYVLMQNKGKASLGNVRLEFRDKKAVITSGTVIGSPLYKAGLDREAALLKLDGKKLKNQKALDRILAKHKPGDELLLEYESLGKVNQTRITLIEDPAMEVKLLEETGKELTPDQSKFRKSWLGSKSNSVD